MMIREISQVWGGTVLKWLCFSFPLFLGFNECEYVEIEHFDFGLCLMKTPHLTIVSVTKDDVVVVVARGWLELACVARKSGTDDSHTNWTSSRYIRMYPGHTRYRIHHKVPTTSIHSLAGGEFRI